MCLQSGQRSGENFERYPKTHSVIWATLALTCAAMTHGTPSLHLRGSQCRKGQMQATT